MGGSIVTNFLYESPLADGVAGAVLDSPMLDFGPTVDLGARHQGAPSFLRAVSKRIPFSTQKDSGVAPTLWHRDRFLFPMR